MTWFLMPSSSASSVVLSWKTKNWKILPFVPTAWTIIGRSKICCGWVWAQRKGTKQRNRQLFLWELRAHNITSNITLPHKAYVHMPRHFQMWTWASWLWIVQVAAYSHHQLPPGNTRYVDEGMRSPLRNLTTWHHNVLEL